MKVSSSKEQQDFSAAEYPDC